ncbi:MAG: Gfo/Idh/MocA family oxidoreductase [Dehalococcoidales bacterium]|jgi:predicted dehydrogenase
MDRLNILVVGTGMYVCGRGTSGDGTIMPAIFEWGRTGNIGKVIVAGRSASGAKEARKKVNALSRKMGVSIPVSFYPQGNDDAKAYLKAIKDMPRPACALVATPDRLHKRNAKAAIKAGLNTLVVKPLVSTAAEVRSLVGLQKRMKVYCAVEFHKRYDDANLKLRDAISQGAIGDPLYFLAEFSQRKSMPEKVFRRWAASTNIFQYLGIHYVDMIHFVTKAKPVRAMATGQSYWLKSKGIDTYDAVEAVTEWKMKNGKRFVSHILTNWIDPEKTSAMSDQKIKVIGTKGRFESDQKDRGVTMVTDKNGIEEINPYFCGQYGPYGNVRFRGYGIDSIKTFLDDSIAVEYGSKTIEELEKERPTFSDSLISTMVLEAVNASLKGNGKWVEIGR